MEGHRCRGEAPLGRSAGQPHQRRGGHRRGSAPFGLAASHLGGERPGGGDERPDEPGGKKRTGHLQLAKLHPLGQRDDDAGQRRARPGRRHRDDDPHRALHFHQRRHIEDRPVQRPTVEELSLSEGRVESPRLPPEDPIGIGRAGDPDSDRAPQNADDLHHHSFHRRLIEAAARHFILDGQLPQRFRTGIIAGE